MKGLMLAVCSGSSPTAWRWGLPTVFSMKKNKMWKAKKVNLHSAVDFQRKALCSAVSSESWSQASVKFS